MIVYANGRVQGTDIDGDTQPVAVIGAHQEELRIGDEVVRDYLHSVIKELRIMNIHLTSMTDMSIDRQDMEV